MESHDTASSVSGSFSWAWCLRGSGAACGSGSFPSPPSCVHWEWTRSPIDGHLAASLFGCCDGAAANTGPKSVRTGFPLPRLDAQEWASRRVVSPFYTRTHSAEFSALHFLTLLVVSDASCPVGCEVGLLVGLDCIALITDAVEHLFMGL